MSTTIHCLRCRKPVDIYGATFCPGCQDLWDGSQERQDANRKGVFGVGRRAFMLAFVERTGKGVAA